MSLEEQPTYFSSPAYKSDVVELDSVLSNELLLLHKVAEICFLKEIGCAITRDIIVEAHPDTYHAHLKTLDIEFAEAEKRDNREWLSRRCKDLESYSTDPYLLRDLESLISKLVNKYCGKRKKAEKAHLSRSRDLPAGEPPLSLRCSSNQHKYFSTSLAG